MFLARLFSALFYAIASLLIVFVNKIVLTSYKFPSFQILALGQLTITVLGFLIAKYFNLIQLPKLNMVTFRQVMPLPLFYFCNLLWGLGGTKSLNLPMFSVMRRFSVLLTMYGELFILKVNKPLKIQFSIYLMVLGAVIAALDDLSFDLYGYIYITLNNVFTAANGIYTKRKLNLANLDEYGILYYNSILSIIPMFLLSIYTGEINKLNGYSFWSNTGFWFYFVLSSLMGFMLNYSCMLCTKYSSPLTTTVVGTLKNILVTYVGMFIGGDYIYSQLNFIGLTISAFSSVYYSYLTFKKPKSKE